jgi:FkbM family methyltransferase
MNKLIKLGMLAVRPSTIVPLARTRTAAAIEHLGMLRFTKPGTVIDVGANKGQFALAVRAVRPGAKIVAFEPLGSEADIFERNFARTEGVQLHRMALGSSSALATFYVGNRADSSSLLRPGVTQQEAFGVHATGTVDVQVRRLDEVYAPAPHAGPILLKIDVQGAEAEVIAGASTILPAISFVYAEASFVELYEGQPLADDLVDSMRGYGFALRGVYNQHVSPKFGPLQADLLFEHENRPSSQ